MKFRLVLLLSALVAVGACGPADRVTQVEHPARLNLRIADMRFYGRDIAAVARIRDETGAPAVLLTFTPSGRRRFARLQQDRIGQPLEIRVDGELVSAPLLHERIDSASLMIAGNLDRAEADRLAQRLTPRPVRR